MNNRRNEVFLLDFIAAARTGDKSTVKKFISQHHKKNPLRSKKNKERLAYAVDCTNWEGESALIVAIDNNHVDIVRILLKAGANPNGMSHHADIPLVRANRLGNNKIIKLLLDAGATNLYITTRNNDVPASYMPASASAAAVHHDSPDIADRPIEIIIHRPANEGAVIPDSRSTINSEPMQHATLSFAERLAAIPDFDEKQHECLLSNLIDPISQEIMTDPITVSSGQTYDRHSLAAYFEAKGNPETLRDPVRGDKHIHISELKKTERAANLYSIIENFVTQQEKESLARRATKSNAAAAAAIASEYEASARFFTSVTSAPDKKPALAPRRP